MWNPWLAVRSARERNTLARQCWQLLYSAPGPASWDDRSRWESSWEALIPHSSFTPQQTPAGLCFPRWVPNKRRGSPTPYPKRACQNWSVCVVFQQRGVVSTERFGAGPLESPRPDLPTSQLLEWCTNFICKNQAERGTERSPRPSGPCNKLSLPENHHARPTHQSSAQPTDTPPK